MALPHIGRRIQWPISKMDTRIGLHALCNLESQQDSFLSSSNHTVLLQDRHADSLNYFVVNTPDATVAFCIMTKNAPILRALPFSYFYYASEAVCPLSRSDFGISEVDLKACLQIRQSVSALYSTRSPFKGILYVQLVFLLLQYGHHISDSSDLDFCTSVLCHTNYK
jgi:hypothetical protein